MASRLCRACEKWHDLGEDWPAKCYAHFKARTAASVQIIRDIEPYMPIAADTDGKRHAIGGRRQHREFLQRNGYREVGNDVPTKPKEVQYDLATPRDVKQAIDQLRNR